MWKKIKGFFKFLIDFTTFENFRAPFRSPYEGTPVVAYNHLDDILSADEEWIIEHVNGELAIGTADTVSIYTTVKIDSSKVLIFPSQQEAQGWYNQHLEGLPDSFNWRVGRQ